MLELLIERREGFDESTNQFVTIPEKRIELEHSPRSHKADRRLSSGQSNCHLVPGRRG